MPKDVSAFTDSCMRTVEGLVNINRTMFSVKQGVYRNSRSVYAEQSGLIKIHVLTVFVKDDGSWNITFFEDPRHLDPDIDSGVTMCGYDVASLRDTCYTACKAVERSIIHMNNPVCKGMLKNYRRKSYDA